MRQICVTIVAVSLLLAGCGPAVRSAAGAEPERAPAAAEEHPGTAHDHPPSHDHTPAAMAEPAASEAPAERTTGAPSSSHAGGHHHSAAELRTFPNGIRPARIRIPAIDVDTKVIALGQQRDGSLETPEDFALAGWWRGGPRPGAPGAAVIAGHVDSRRGPAVFYELRALAVGEEILVEDKDGDTESFTVERLVQVPKDEFPTDLVYGYTRTPSLRLITCGGAFDRSVRSYRDNIVVFASHGSA